MSTVSSDVTSVRTGSTEKTMVNRTTPRFRSPYEERLELVKNTLTTCSAFDDDAAGKVAVHVLHALNSIPREGALHRSAYQAPSPTAHSRNARSTAAHKVSLSFRELGNPSLAFVAEHFAFR